MKNTTYLASACLSLFAACSGPTSTSPTPTSGGPRTVTLTLDGSVHDSVSRPVPGLPTQLNVALSGASFVVGNDVSPTNSLLPAIAGDYVRFALDPYDFGGYITERLAPATYVQLVGSVTGPVGASGFSLPFDGRF